jgi:hypothetical protein
MKELNKNAPKTPPAPNKRGKSNQSVSGCESLNKPPCGDMNTDLIASIL